MPGQQQRKQAVRRKLNAMSLEFVDKNVILVDGGSGVLAFASPSGASPGPPSDAQRATAGIRTRRRGLHHGQTRSCVARPRRKSSSWRARLAQTKFILPPARRRSGRRRSHRGGCGVRMHSPRGRRGSPSPVSTAAPFASGHGSFPNVYGIDMPTKEELVAHNRSEADIAKEIGADAVIYLVRPLSFFAWAARPRSC